METAGIEHWTELADRREVRAAASTAHRRFAGGRWNWFALRGAASLVAGLLLLFFAFSPFTLVAILLASFLAIDGIFSIGSGLDAPRTIDGKGSARVLRGIIGLASGLVLFVLGLFGSSAMLPFFMLLALWAVVAGSLDFAVAVQTTKRIQVDWMAAGAGLLSVLGGAALPLIALSSSKAPEYAIILLVAILLLVTGLLLTGHAFGLDRGKGENS